MINFRKLSTQELLGWRSFTPYGLDTDKGELLFFEISPINVSVLSPVTVAQKILDMTKLFSALPDLEVVCMDSAENFELNKLYLHQRSEKEQNPMLRELLEKDMAYLDNIQIEMSTARRFIFMVRCYNLKPEAVFQLVNEAEQKIAGNNFTVRRMGKADIKRLLALYFDAGDYGDRLPDMDDGQYL